MCTCVSILSVNVHQKIKAEALGFQGNACRCRRCAHAFPRQDDLTVFTDPGWDAKPVEPPGRIKKAIVM